MNGTQWEQAERYRTAVQRHALSLTERPASHGEDTRNITEDLIAEVVEVFYQRVRHDELLGPVFEAQIASWDIHLAKMRDFWSSALLKTGRYSGQPVRSHQLIGGLTSEHFERWLKLFEQTVRELGQADQADVFLSRARKMRDAMVWVLGLEERDRAPLSHMTG